MKTSKSIVEILNAASLQLMNEGVTGDIVIHNESLWERARWEMINVPYIKPGMFPTNGMIEFYCPTGKIILSKDPPEPSPETIEKKVRDELNRRAMQIQKYGRRNP